MNLAEKCNLWLKAGKAYDEIKDPVISDETFVLLRRLIDMQIAALRDWKNKRIDGRVENHWKKIASECTLKFGELYQQKWNFIESEYSERPSNNGLDLGNPSFAFTTNLAKYIEVIDYEYFR
jgi:hypothetical protein